MATKGTSENKSNNSAKKVDSNYFDNSKIYALLAYIPLIGWILPLFVKKEDKSCQFHGKQGFILSILALLLGLSGFIVYTDIFKYLLTVLYFAFFIGAFVYGAYAAYNSKNTEIPVISAISKKIFEKFQI